MNSEDIKNEIKSYIKNNPKWYWEDIEKYFDERYKNQDINEKVENYKARFLFEYC